MVNPFLVLLLVYQISRKELLFYESKEGGTEIGNSLNSFVLLRTVE